MGAVLAVFTAARPALVVPGIQGSRGAAWRARTHAGALAPRFPRCLQVFRACPSALCACAVSQHSRLRSGQHGLEAADSGLDTVAPAVSTELTKHIVGLAYGRFRLEIPSWIC